MKKFKDYLWEGSPGIGVGLALGLTFFKGNWLYIISVSIASFIFGILLSFLVDLAKQGFKNFEKWWIKD